VRNIRSDSQIRVASMPSSKQAAFQAAVLILGVAIIEGLTYGGFVFHTSQEEWLGLAVLGGGWLALSGYRERRMRQAIETERRSFDNRLKAARRDAMATLQQYREEFDAQHTANRAELQKLQQLLADAITRLLDSFGALHRLGEAQHCLARTGSADAEELDRIAGEIEGHVRSAVVSLQFQDMATQLIGHVQLRLEQSDSMLQKISGLPAVFDFASSEPVGSSWSPSAEALEELRAGLDIARERAHRNPVHQRNMGMGAVELF
jgi:hypothetical protein